MTVIAVSVPIAVVILVVIPVLMISGALPPIVAVERRDYAATQGKGGKTGKT